MIVTELRNKLIERIAEISADEDEEALAKALTYARAALVTLTGLPKDEDIQLETLEVNTRTAALVLSIHPEYVRSLIRSKQLSATKENGEFRIQFADLLAHLAKAMKSPGKFRHQAHTFDPEHMGVVVWRREEPKA